ncbi:MAG: winged helix-turn-helix domain-containing protein [Candidatus Bathyarchaeia archaeon]
MSSKTNSVKRSNTHRGCLDIIAEILEASQDNIKKTYLMNRCNLSFRQLNYYLEFLHKKGLLNGKSGHGNLSSVGITEKGRKFLKAYKGLKNLMT